MRCAHCGRPGIKAYHGYCTKVHRDLARGPSVVVLSCARCGAPVPRTGKQAGKASNVFCKRCPKNSGETHPRWKEGQHFNQAGYRLILINGGYKLEHRHTWEQANRACLLPEGAGIVSIHHINMVKADNRPENLVMLTNQDHGRLHRFIDAGRFKEAKHILIKSCREQFFFTSNKEHLKWLQDTPLEDVLYQS